MIGKSQQNNLKIFWAENQRKCSCIYQRNVNSILGLLNHMQILISETRMILAKNIYGIPTMRIKTYKCM